MTTPQKSRAARVHELRALIAQGMRSARRGQVVEGKLVVASLKQRLRDAEARRPPSR